MTEANRYQRCLDYRALGELATEGAQPVSPDASLQAWLRTRSISRGGSALADVLSARRVRPGCKYLRPRTSSPHAA